MDTPCAVLFYFNHYCPIAIDISNESLNQKYDLNINIVLETDEFGINKEPIFVGATGSLHRGFTDLSLNTGIKNTAVVRFRFHLSKIIVFL